jgi:hypothetical protein
MRRMTGWTWSPKEIKVPASFFRSLLFLPVIACAACSSSGSKEAGPLGRDSADPAMSLDLGNPCVLAGLTGNQIGYGVQASECSSRICVKTLGPGGPYCTSECQNDSDCQGADDGRCKAGYACGIAYVMGPLCCKKVCICREFHGQAMAVPIACDPSLSPDGRVCADSTTDGSSDGGMTIIPPALPPDPPTWSPIDAPFWRSSRDGAA